MFNWRKSKKSKNKQFNNAATEFEEIMNCAKYYYRSEDINTSDKLTLLRYMADVIRTDLQSEYIVDMFYKPEARKFEQILVPKTYCDELNQEHTMHFNIDNCKRIDFNSNCCIIVQPWQKDRMKDNIIHILKEGFKFYKNNHCAHYYDGLNICCVINGNHSISTGVYSKKGYIDAQYVDVKPMFNHVKTDGKNFYNIHNDEWLWPVQDFRIAAVFEIEKMIYNLNNNQ